ncbi:LOW QUALITY PROTEIN: protein mahjong [Drosophila gunungcola]|uniref:LOW QUALITY PROTEIN: protein mahjong n=1 Tax=Drosophila gunungcola TaxID=103775 RepID=UPI0022E7FF22|nr:LOW QUALITY PROTEIN: protein mahjong [Drosophila gunungcola]
MSEGSGSENAAGAAAAAETEAATDAAAEAEAATEAALMAEAVAVAYQSEDEEEADAEEDQDADAAGDRDQEEEPAEQQDEVDPEAEEEADAEGDAMSVENESDSGGNPEETAAADRRQATKKELTQIIDKWEQQQTQNGYDPVPTLRSLAEIFEREKDVYRRKDPDPLDSRHPYRADPSCQYGLLLKLLFRRDTFMGKLLNDYLRENYFSRQNVSRSSLELNILACRLILEIMPGMETSAVFQTAEGDGTINRIYSWAEDSIEPLQSYATGLLAEAMEVSDIAINFRDQNMRLVPKMIKRLHMLLAISKSATPDANTSQHNQSADSSAAGMLSWVACASNASAPQSPQHNGSGLGASSSQHGDASNMSILFENSRDAFPVSRYYKRMYIPLHPPTADTSQMLIMRFLTSLGEYQEFLAMAFENNVMQLIFGYLENLDRRDTCLAYEVLKYLASLLCHKKFALEFISHGGLELLLKVPRPSLATTGVSIAIYYLAYCEDAMERICSMQRPLISELVRYALWILGRCHDSSKCHATMFFSLSFQFKVILEEFDAQDGLRKLYNVISVLKILDPSHNDSDNDSEINEDVECASRQMVRHVCVALKRYMEAHFFYKYNSFLCQHNAASSSPSSAHFFSQNPTVAAKLTFDQLHDQIRTLQEHTSIRAHWQPVDQLMKLGGITMLLRIIAFSYDWVNSGRSETVRSALDVLSVCCIIPRVYVVLCERLLMLDKTTTSGFCSVLGAAAGEITSDAEVLKSALAVLCHCVCSPIIRKDSGTSLIKFGNSSRKNKANHKYAEELIERVWESVCSNNGIVVLLSLMQTKGPITDADCIRGMACRALAGLARSDRVRQIVSKLPLFAGGQLQTLMRDPILQEKRAEHVIFQKYALELLERVSGKTKPLNNPLDPSLSNMHKANVIAQTRIQYNKQQLYQLIFEHLESNGLSQTAQMLQREVGLPLQTPTTRSFHQSPFDYKALPSGSGSLSRNRLRSRMQDVNAAIMASGDLNRSFGEDSSPAGGAGSSSSAALEGVSIPNFGCLNTTQTPIKIRRTDRNSVSRSIQKQMLEPGGMSMASLPDDAPFHPKRITLNTIVTEYLTNQHSLCNNPVTTCPQFDLYEPHKCPDPKPSRLLSSNYNLTSRHARTQAGFNTGRFDRRYVHTHFSPWRSIRSADYEDLEFTCCDLVGKYIIVGTQQGDGRVFNMNDGVEQFFSNCHNFSVDAIKANRAGDLVITSSFWRTPTSILWSIADDEFKLKLRLPDVTYCEFSQTAQDRLLGTQNECATLFDINTGSKVASFTPTIPNLYTKNRATLCRTDELILSDGVLWDVRSGKEIHKFDKFNQCISGVFHPNCLEIIANTEVWDLRTFHLLQTVPVLDQRNCTFSPMHVIYGASLGADRDHDMETTTYDTSFNVLDAYDYSSIATIDVKRNINDLSVSANGSLIAVVEDYSGYESKQETYVKIYAVGVKKSERSEEEDDEEVPESDEDGSDTGSENTFALGPNFMGFPLLRNLNGSDNDEDGDLDEDDDDGDLLDSDDDDMDDDDDGINNPDDAGDFDELFEYFSRSSSDD